MKKIIYSLLTFWFLVSCSSGVGGDESIEPNNSIEELIINKQWWFESSDNTYGLFFGNNDSLFHIDEFCNSSFDGIYTINSDSTIDIMTYENGLQIIESWEIYYVTDEELSITINNSNSTIINQIFNINNIPDLCSQEMSDYLTQNIFYSDINNLENESCFRKKMIFNDDGTGIGGDICNLNFEDSIINFNWSLSGTTLEIVFTNQSISKQKNQILSIDNGLLFDESLYVGGDHNHTFWYTTTPEFENQDWVNYNFKHTYRYYNEREWIGQDTWIDTLVILDYWLNNIYSFCEYNPYVKNTIREDGNIFTNYMFCNQWLDGIDEYDVPPSSISFENDTLKIRTDGYGFEGSVDYVDVYSIIE